MRITLILIFLLCCCGCARNDSTSTQQPGSFETLFDLAGNDLSELDDDQKSKVWRLLSESDGLPFAFDAEKLDSLELRFVKPFKSGQAAWVFVAAYPGYDIPDVSAAHIHVFDDSWNRLCVQTFPTGYRFFQRGIDIASETTMEQDLVRFKLTSAGPFFVSEDGDKTPAFEQGKNYQLQYYAFVDDRIALVRLEDDSKTVAPNSYRWSAPMKGPEILDRRHEDWIESLKSENPSEILESLVVLSGGHLSSTEQRHANVNQQNLETSSFIESLIDSPAINSAIDDLHNSKYPWINDYIELYGKMKSNNDG